MTDIVYFPYSELPVLPPTKEEFDALVSSLKKLPTLFTLTMLNNFLALFDSKFHSKEAGKIQHFLIANFLDDELLNILNQHFIGMSLIQRPLFHRQQMLVLMKKVLLESTLDGDDKVYESPTERYQLGKACLMLNDFLLTNAQTQKLHAATLTGQSNEVLDELLVQLLSPNELINLPDITHSFVRNVEFVEILNETTYKYSDGSSVNGRFLATTGLDLLQQLKCIYAVLVWYFNQKDYKKLNDNPENFNIRKSSYFVSLGLSLDQVSSFFDLNAVTATELEKNLKKNHSSLNFYNDFLEFRKFPLLYLTEDVLTCFDISFLIEKLESGFFHTIRNSLPEQSKERNLFSTYWGDVFHKYVNSLFIDVYQDSRYLGLQMFDDTKTENEAFDGVIDYGDSIVVMEYKGGFLTTQAKYSGGFDVFIADLDRKFGRKKHAGIEQLKRKIEIVFNVDIKNRRTFFQQDFSQIKRIFPVLIVQEPALSSGFANWKLRNIFEEEKDINLLRTDIKVELLTVITIEDLEKILPYFLVERIVPYVIRKFWFIEVLENFTSGQYPPHIPFITVFNEFKDLYGIPRRHSKRIWDKYESINSEMIEIMKQNGFDE